MHDPFGVEEFQATEDLGSIESNGEKKNVFITSHNIIDR